MPSSLSLPSDIVQPAVSSMNDSSIFSYFFHANFLIKIVMLSLLFASIYSLAIIFFKYKQIKKVNREADYFEEEFWSGVPIDTLYKRLQNTSFDPMSNVFCAAMAEFEQAAANGYKDLRSRLERATQIAISKEVNELEKNLVFLSTLGTNGVIVGLFGTVMGILGGFKVIATQQSASIATVGPVISEALVTTALGIFTSIPAAIAYNKYMDNINRYLNRLEVFSNEFISILTRQES